MNRNDVTSLDRSLARVCELCPVCRNASTNQKGFAYSFVKTVEASICPFCRTYMKVYGKKAIKPEVSRTKS
jgi:hypothetical protein